MANRKRQKCTNTEKQLRLWGFVLMYMETLLKRSEIDWVEHKSWQKDMPKYRAEVVCRTLEAFWNAIIKKCPM
ncbi:hypothetical protein KSP40_PGU000597 [Platanthera guangdongensis]|uniref:Transposase n=1 Tax=Platanthera guangdongensis TaxID=2320717 RepID=A0ABR2M9S3_9ASPA